MSRGCIAGVLVLIFSALAQGFGPPLVTAYAAGHKNVSRVKITCNTSNHKFEIYLGQTAEDLAKPIGSTAKIFVHCERRIDGVMIYLCSQPSNKPMQNYFLSFQIIGRFQSDSQIYQYSIADLNAIMELILDGLHRIGSGSAGSFEYDGQIFQCQYPIEIGASEAGVAAPAIPQIDSPPRPPRL